MDEKKEYDFNSEESEMLRDFETGAFRTVPFSDDFRQVALNTLNADIPILPEGELLDSVLHEPPLDYDSNPKNPQIN